MTRGNQRENDRAKAQARAAAHAKPKTSGGDQLKKHEVSQETIYITFHHML
jgi:hypothetical protein